jgi:hypothetical protein
MPVIYANNADLYIPPAKRGDAKLIPQHARAIRQRMAGLVAARKAAVQAERAAIAELATQYGLHPRTVRKIANRDTWKDVE